MPLPLRGGILHAYEDEEGEEDCRPWWTACDFPMNCMAPLPLQGGAFLWRTEDYGLHQKQSTGHCIHSAVDWTPSKGSMVEPTAHYEGCGATAAGNAVPTAAPVVEHAAPMNIPLVQRSPLPLRQEGLGLW